MSEIKINEDGSKQVTVTFTKTLADKQLQLMKDTLTTAIEGGINYWAMGRNAVREKGLTYVSCELCPAEQAFEKGDKRNAWQKVGPAEIEADRRPVHMAITWSQDGMVACFRDGKPYGRPYRTSAPPRFAKDAAVVLLGLKVVKSASLGKVADWDDEGQQGDPAEAERI